MNLNLKNSQYSNTSTNETSLSMNCIFHPQNIIHNFCTSQQCLLPLCATCIGIHSTQHEHQHTYGTYMNINKLRDELVKFLKRITHQLQDISQQYTEDYWNKDKIVECCKKSLNDVKKKTILRLQRSFQHIQKELLRQIQEFQDTCHHKYKQLEQQMQYLYESIRLQLDGLDVTNDKVIRNMIIHLGERKTQQINLWCNKFKDTVNILSQESIRVKVDENLFRNMSDLENGELISVERFIDNSNMYLLASGRSIVKSQRNSKSNNKMKEPSHNIQKNITNKKTMNQY